MVDGRSRAATAQRVLVAFFLTAACEASDRETYDEPLEEREAVDCDIQIACGDAASEEECTPPWQPPDCTEIHYDAFEACIDAMKDALADIEDGGSCEARDYRQACRDTDLYVDFGSCGTTAGRPLYVDGQQALPVVVRTGRPATSPESCAAEHWLRCAQLEAASVPAFRRLRAELAQLGAPASLLEAADRAADEEVRHTHLCLAQANALSEAEQFSLRPMGRVEPRPDATLEQLAVEALLEGCIAEGSASAWAAIASESADADPASVLRTIAADELRHATLSWRLIGWALLRKPELADRLLAALDGWERDEGSQRATSAGREDLTRFGVLSPARERAITRDLVATVVRPTLEALCRSRSNASLRG